MAKARAHNASISGVFVPWRAPANNRCIGGAPAGRRARTRENTSRRGKRSILSYSVNRPRASTTSASGGIPSRARVAARSPPRRASTSIPSGTTGSSQASVGDDALLAARAATANDFTNTSRPAVLEQKMASPAVGG